MANANMPSESWRIGKRVMRTNLTPEQRQKAVAKAVATRRRNTELRKLLEQRKIESADELSCLIKEREQILENLNRHIKLSSHISKLTGHTLLREQEIVAGAQKWEGFTGVYFLVHLGRVVYVGQATNIFARIHSHVDKVFDSFAYVPCTHEQLDTLESLYIHCLRPSGNGVVNGRVIAPLQLNQILK